MVEKRYKWTEGATLEDHSRRKHKILREYVFKYLIVRCQLPQQSRFRLAIVDGFAGGGRYGCGAPGSPIIFLEELRNATEFVNAQRAVKGLGVIEIECLLVLNDVDRDVVEILKQRGAALWRDQTSRSPTPSSSRVSKPAIRERISGGKATSFRRSLQERSLQS